MSAVHTKGQPIVIVGAGGHGREILSVASACGRTVIGFVDDIEPDLSRLTRIDSRFLGAPETIAELGTSFLIGIGDPGSRCALADRLQRAGCEATVLMHPASTFGLDVVWDE